MRLIEKIVIHHSATHRDVTFKAIDQAHKDKGYDGFGYHLFLNGNAMVLPGRHVEKIGAHAIRHNINSIGICVAGNNVEEGQHWTPQQVAALRAVVHTLQWLYPRAEVVGHRDLEGAATLCPGLDVSALGLWG